MNRMKTLLYLLLIVSMMTCSGNGKVNTNDRTPVQTTESYTVSVKDFGAIRYVNLKLVTEF